MGGGGGGGGGGDGGGGVVVVDIVCLIAVGVRRGVVVKMEEGSLAQL